MGDGIDEVACRDATKIAQKAIAYDNGQRYEEVDTNISLYKRLILFRLFTSTLKLQIGWSIFSLRER